MCHKQPFHFNIFNTVLYSECLSKIKEIKKSKTFQSLTFSQYSKFYICKLIIELETELKSIYQL